jgi:photosystem II stability/assembly factor-like uncharacterized protein
MIYQMFAGKFSLSILLIASIMMGAAPAAVAMDGGIYEDKTNSATWQVVGPFGGDVRSVAIDPKDKDRIYISTMDGQIHTSADGGTTWRLLVNLNEPLLIIDNLLVDRTDSNRIYASGNRGNEAGGFFYSADGGSNWKSPKVLRDQSIHSLTQAAHDPKTLFVGTRNGVWRSTDSGESWEKIESTSMPINVNSMAVDPRNVSTIYAGTWWRPYKSTDSGKSWRLIKNGMIDDSDVFAISINKENPSHLFASACSGIYESTNGGDNWRKIQGIPSTSRRTRDIMIHPSDPSRVYAATTEGFWMSANGGKTWSMTTQRNLEINSIAVHPDLPNRVFIGTNNHGVMVSNDGGRNFVPTNNNFTSRFTYSIAPDLSQPNRLYATTKNTSSSGGFVFISNDAGRTWTQAKGLDINLHAAFAIMQDRVDENKLYLGTNVGLFQSIDRGLNWKLITAAKPAKKAPAKRMNAAQRRAAAAAAKKAAEQPAGPLMVPALGERIKVLAYTEDEKNGILAGTDNGLYRTYDAAKGWEKLAIGEGLNASITAIYTSPNVPGTIWAGTAMSGVIVSTDDGKTWSKTNSSPDNTPVSSIIGDPKDPNKLYVGTIQSLYLSRDGGRTWVRRGGNLPLGNYTSILINPNNSKEILVSSAHENEGGVYYSEDAGMNWKRFDSKGMTLPSRRFWSMAFDPADPNRIYAGSHSSGVYIINRRQDVAAGTAAQPVSGN